MGRTVFRDLDRVLPGRIVNLTNGISFRRWLFEANPEIDRAADANDWRIGSRRSRATRRARISPGRPGGSCRQDGGSFRTSSSIWLNDRGIPI
jgi:hypothetical protein